MWVPERRIGQLLGGKYRVQQMLALGGMGVIYSACHELTGRSVAIKLLRPELATRPELMRRVAIEARLAVEASHPNVVEVLDAGADELGIPYVVLERLYGRPLEELLGERLSLLAAVQALLPVMNALVTLHEAGIVHRDIKPSNIFLSCEAERVVPKLLDFGIAKALSSADSTLSSVALGTPSYMAPEQALGCVAPGPATDVWSMAVVFVRCLTGRLPFASVREKGPSVSSFAFDPAGAAGVPPAIAQVLARALQLDPRDRFANMAELRSALLDALPAEADGVGWPSADTVAYATHEFELADLPALKDSSIDTSGSGKNSRAARPADVLTRTFSRALQVTYGRRWRRAVLAAFIGLVGVSALYLSSRERAEQPSSAVGPGSVLDAPPAVRASQADVAPAAAAIDSLHARTGATSAPGELEPMAASAPGITGAKGAGMTQPRLRSLLGPVPNERVAPEEAARVSVPLGPNRSPIIE